MNGDSRAPGPRRRLAISAFGIHTGGGLVLLRALMKAASGQLRSALLDRRLQDDAALATGAADVRYVDPTLIARVSSLAGMAAECVAGDVLLCFNSLPPLRPTAARVITFVQAPHMVGLAQGVSYSAPVQLRVWLERLWLQLGARHCNELWVQTRSMERATQARFPHVLVRRVPLVDDRLLTLLQTARAGVAAPASPRPAPQDASFFYPADGVSHKNHATLLQAWRLLQVEGMCPRLTLTLDASEFAAALLAAGLQAHDVPQVHSIGRQPREAVLDRIQQASALLFASRAETFGLPMLEARALGVPILAGERDFVRDVCTPAQTFDPTSPNSIVDAVRRFVAGAPAQLDECCSAAQFVHRLQA